jgi:preprotein translocase subunit SecG
MTTVLLILFLLVTLALIGVILVQRSEGGGLGIGSSGGGMGSLMGGRGTANLLTRTTAILGSLFFALALTLALLDRGTALNRSILDTPPASTLPAVPAVPTVPTN